ncbi:MAG: Ribonuclease HII [Sodalis sp.]|nr:MAG: Ribonuclease HII [Sodalis sp.]
MKLIRSIFFRTHCWRCSWRLRVWPTRRICTGGRQPLPMPSQAVVKGDSRVAEISAASIIAKVIRDRGMTTLYQQFCEYDFAKHKEYLTAFHLKKSWRCMEDRSSSMKL